MRQTSDDLGAFGDLMFAIVIIAGFGVVVVATAGPIRWAILTAQRAVVLPGRIDFEEACRRVLDAIVSRVRRRATTLTLSPLPVVSVDDAWWKAAVERSIAEASLVIFILAGRESAPLQWEIDRARQRFDPHRTLSIELGGEVLSLRDGTGRPLPSPSPAEDDERIDAAARSMLFENGSERTR